MQFLLRPGNVLAIAILALAGGAAVWLMGESPWTGGPAAAFNGLGRLAGVLGMMMLLLSAIVSMRVPRLDVPFGGITELWKTHHVLGAGSLVFLMLHPLLLALSKLSISPRAAASVLVPPADAAASWLGWASLLGMMTFLAPTFFFAARNHYRQWKALHAVSGVAVALGVMHTVMLARTIPLWVWWSASAVTLTALVFRLIWRKIRPGRRFLISDVQPLTDQVVELTLTPAGGAPLRHMAGQFIYLAPLDATLAAGCGEEHPYTITSPPGDENVRTVIKDLGDATRALQQVRPGTAAWVDGPYGRFFVPGLERPELWIGGGIGIAPFVGRARSFQVGQGDVNIDLIYCTDHLTGPYLLDELQSIAAATPGFRVIGHFFDEKGPLTGEALQAHVPELPEREVYVCGPEGLVEWSVRYCRSAGVPARRIHSEAFGFL